MPVQWAAGSHCFAVALHSAARVVGALVRSQAGSRSAAQVVVALVRSPAGWHCFAKADLRVSLGRCPEAALAHSAQCGFNG